MKKLIGLIIILVGLFILPLQTFAVDYSIEEMKIHAFLQENGDVHVKEEQTYDFDGKFNGISRTLIPKTDTSIEDVEATESGEALKVEKEDDLYKIYRSGKDETITIELTYTIKEAVDAYADVAEFYWPFFDSNNESAYEQLDVFVYPPNDTDDAIAFGYDAAENKANVQKDGLVHFAMGKVASETKGDIRVAYDVKLFPHAEVTNDKQMRDEILAAKQELEEKREKFTANQKKMKAIAPFIVVVVSTLLLALLLYAWRKRQTTKLEVERLYPLPYFVPEEEMSLPATISYTNMGMIQPETITAALLDLVRKGYVKQESEEAFIDQNRKTNYEHEQLLIDWLFYKIGQQEKFQVTDLKTYTDKKANRKTYYEDFTAWKKAIQDEVKEYELTEKHPKIRWTAGLVGLLMIPIGILFAVYSLLFYLFFAIFSSLAFVLFAITFRPRTLLGAKITRDWTVFQSKYVELNEQGWTELVDDEHKRAFIYGIGINDKKIKKKNEAMLAKMPNIQYSETGMNPLLFVLIATNVNSHFSEANKVTAASSSGGGTAGGGTGVGGGGGGSGAF